MGDNITDFDWNVKYVIYIGHYYDLKIISKMKKKSIELLSKIIFEGGEYH